jgi:hypothetical protein
MSAIGVEGSNPTGQSSSFEWWLGGKLDMGMPGNARTGIARTAHKKSTPCKKQLVSPSF